MRKGFWWVSASALLLVLCGALVFVAAPARTYRSGEITYMLRGPRDQPCAIDFSSLADAFSGDLYETPPVERADLTIVWDTTELRLPPFDIALESPYGVLDAGGEERFPCEFCAGVGVKVEDWMPRLLSVRIPGGGYERRVPVRGCGLYWVRTAEGNYVMLLAVGWYIGGIDRVHFWWVDRGTQ